MAGNSKISYELSRVGEGDGHLCAAFAVDGKTFMMTEAQLEKYAGDETKPADRRAIAEEAAKVVHDTDPLNTPQAG